MQLRLIVKAIFSVLVFGLAMSCGDEEIVSVEPSGPDKCFVVDQANYEEPGHSGFISIGWLGGSVGQEFRPTRRRVDEIRLKFNDSNIDSGTVFVRLRDSNITGQILGKSREHELVLSGLVGDFDLDFRFPVQVVVYPERLYVFEVVVTDDFGLGIVHGADYARGRAVYGEEPKEAMDFFFELGEYVDCPPDTTAAAWGIFLEEQM